MPASERIVLCGGASAPPRVTKERLLRIGMGDGDSDVRLRIADITNRLTGNLPPILTDLIEVASYVYSADQAITRGGENDVKHGLLWRRKLSFHIPVREPDLWSSKQVVETLRETLGFLSDDEYHFHFSKYKNPPPLQSYLELQPSTAEAAQVDEVVLFSGGLDSLGGAVLETVRDKRRVAFVSHRANPKIDSKQKLLVEDLRLKAAERPLHIPVWVQKGRALDREYTQRTRSFLFASLAAVIARAFELRRIRFYENGVVSLNLPISEQAVGGRATRTTHPQVLNGYSKLFQLLTEGAFDVQNPFLWLTKGEVVELIDANGCADLIRHSVSCTHTRDMTNMFTHCGKCSQCISRRFATLASKCAAHDPAEMYKVDLLTGDRESDERHKNVDITMLESFIRVAEDMRTKNEYQLVEMFPEMSRVLRHVRPLSADEVASRIARMHQRHAEEVTNVLREALSNYSAEILSEQLPATCAIILAFPKKYKHGSSKEPAVLEPARQNVVAKKPIFRFLTPSGTGWTDIKIRFIDGHTVTIVVGSIQQCRNFTEMNMKDHRNGDPTIQWKLLEILAQGRGYLSWTSSGAGPTRKKQVQLLARKLQDYFAITENPFHDYKTSAGWRLKLSIEAFR